MPETKKTEAAPPRYRVRSGGISTPTGPVATGAIVTADQIGDAERVQKLLDRGSIEVVTDGDTSDA